MSTIIDTLITDRTQADVDRVRELTAKGFAAMTAAERTEWLAGMKGAYSAADLNRVGTAMNYLKSILNLICGKSITFQAKRDWNAADIITTTQAEEYMAQIQAVRDALTYPAGTPNTPQLNRMTYSDANDIERILVACETLVNNVSKAFRYTGAAECAAGGLI